MPLLYPYDYDTTHEISARSFSSEITPNSTQRTTLIVAGCYIIIIGILWYALTNPLLSLRTVLNRRVCRHVPYLNMISAFSYSFWSLSFFFSAHHRFDLTTSLSVQARFFPFSFLF
jgi:hypothetical protein